MDGPSRRTLENIHGWLADAGDLGFIPVPVGALNGRSLHEQSGRLWEVAPWMPGEPETAHPPGALRVQTSFAALAAFHQRLSQHRLAGPSPGLIARLNEWRSWSGDGFNEVGRRLDLCADIPLTSAARQWLDAARGWLATVGEPLKRAAGVTLALQPCLRDARPEHFLFTGDYLTGLIDFGAMGFETVAADLARLLAEWELHDPIDRDAALNVYSSIRPLGPEETTLIEVFERSSAFLLGGHWVRWRFVEGRVFHEPGAVARGIAKGLARLSTLGGAVVR